MRRAITLLLLLASNSASAAEVSVTLIEGKLGARVNAISFPATLPKELNSGLTNRLYARVSLMDAKETVESAYHRDRDPLRSVGSGFSRS